MNKSDVVKKEVQRRLRNTYINFKVTKEDKDWMYDQAHKANLPPATFMYKIFLEAKMKSRK